MALTYAQIAPAQLLQNMAHDPVPGGEQGFIADQLFDAASTLDTGGLQTGTLRTLSAREKLQAGMEGLTTGLANGARRNRIQSFASGTVPWATQRIGHQKDDAVGDVPNLYNQGITSAAEAARQRNYEVQRAELIRMAMTRKKEFMAARYMFGTDLAGTGLGFTNANTTTAGAALFGGALLSVSTSPAYEMITAVADAVQDSTEGYGDLTMVIGQAMARSLSRNRQILGISDNTIATANGTATSAIASPVRINENLLINRLLGIGNISRVIIASARAEFSLTGTATATNFIMPNAFHIAKMGNAMPTMGTNGLVELKATAGMKFLARENPVTQKFNDDDTVLQWYADAWLDYVMVDANYGFSMFDA